jgi:hypothetical protein
MEQRADFAGEILRHRFSALGAAETLEAETAAIGQAFDEALGVTGEGHSQSFK